MPELPRSVEHANPREQFPWTAEDREITAAVTAADLPPESSTEALLEELGS
jgi:hypothetical protein